jgi:hypothetical protein
MRINICNYEQGLGINGILTKYAKEMQRALIDLGHTCTISHIHDPDAQVNHHINYISYKPSGTIDTTMITHLTGDKNQTEEEKIALIKSQKATGICFSEGVKKKIGLDNLEVVLPAHDEFKIRPIIIAISTNLYPDGRKREEMFTKLIHSIKDQKKFAFRIMGKGWRETLDPLVKMKDKIQVQWVDNFTGDFYNELLNTADYLLYTGDEDALAQSIIDAKYANRKIIAPPQEDIEVDYPFNNQEELNEIFKKLEDNPVSKWTWENYVKKHIKIWEKLLK